MGAPAASTWAGGSRCVRSPEKYRLAGQCLDTPSPPITPPPPGLAEAEGPCGLFLPHRLAFPCSRRLRPRPRLHAQSPARSSGWTFPLFRHRVRLRLPRAAADAGRSSGQRAAADPTGPGLNIGPIRVGTRGPGVGSAVWRGLEKSGLFFLSTRRAILHLPWKRHSRGGTGSEVLPLPYSPSDDWKKELCSENPSGSSDSGCFRSPELPGQGERRPPSPGPHPRSCLFPTEGASWRNLLLNILLGQL